VLPDRRTRAVRLTIWASLGAKAFSVVCTLAQVPIALRYLGHEGYGLWVTLVGITVMLNFVDFGLGIGMQQVMAKAYGRDDAGAIRTAFWRGTAALGAIAAALLIVGVPAAWFGAWADVLNVQSSALRAQCAGAIAVTVIACALGVPLNAGPRLAAAVQRGWIHAGWIAGGSAATLATVAWAAHARWSFTGFVAAATLIPVLQGAGMIWHLTRALRWSPPSRRAGSALQAKPAGTAGSTNGPSDTTWREMLQTSAWAALPQFALAALQSAPALAISVNVGPAAVTGYNLLMRLFSPLLHGQSLMLAPIWPAYTESHVRGDLHWVRHAFLRTMLVAVALVGGLALVTWQAPLLVRWWVHDGTAAPAPSEAWVIWLWAALQAIGQPLFYLLVGLSEMRRLALWGTVGVAAAVVGLFAGGGSALAVIVGGSIGLALVWLPGLALSALAALRRTP
jgi:O-antigen/teichoic acid export membrane protein